MVLAVGLLAAGCGKSNSNPTVSQNNSQSVQPLATASPSPSAGVPSGQLKTIIVPPPTTPYTSTADNFTINFPNAPKISKSIFPSSSARAIPVTRYRQVFSSGGQDAYYTLDVYHYPITYKFSSDYLGTALINFVKLVNIEFPGTTIISQQSTQFLGQSAVTASLLVPLKINGTIVNTGGSLLITVNGQNTYGLGTYGMSQDNYNAFISSFKFTK